MKKKSLLFSALIMLFAFVSCSDESGVIELNNIQKTTDNDKSGQICGEEKVVDLIAGQHINIGKVTVSNDDTTLYVKYETTSDWPLKETHLYVGPESGIPLNGGGNPKIGHFPYSETHNNVYSYTYEIDLADFDECFVVVTHAVSRGETAFGCGDKEFPGKRWGCYFDYCKQECEDDECIEAYALWNNGDGSLCVDNGDGLNFITEVSYGFLTSQNYFLVYLFINTNGCDFSNAEKIGFIKVSLTDENTGELNLHTYFYGNAYKLAESKFYVGQNSNPSMTDYTTISYDPATSSPDDTTSYWPNSRESLYVSAKLKVCPTN